MIRITSVLRDREISMVKLSSKTETRLRYGIKMLSGFACEHVAHAKRNGSTNPDAEHCDKRDMERGACCNGCWARRWAEDMARLVPDVADRGK